MKTRNLKTKIMSILLAIVMLLGMLSMSVLAADDFVLDQGDIMQRNDGTVTENNGMVETNNYDATVETNNGTVTYNYGMVETNYGTVSTNYGMMESNHGTVPENNGTVKNNNYDATVETNNGTVTENNGTVTKNFYTVKTNNGTVGTNYYNATVETNNGTVVTNVIGGTVTDNYGTVETNSGRVVNNYGGTVGGTSAINNYYKLTYEADNVTVSGLTVKNGNSYILSTASVTLAPPSGRHFKSIEITPEGATLTENDNGTYTLSGVTENIELTVITIDHSYSTKWMSDGTNHWHECECGAKADETAHSGGTATCKDKAVCSVCSTAYGELATHNYKDGRCTVCEVADPNYVPETDNPKTGDNSNIALWITLLLLSGGAIIILTVADKERNSVVKR